MDYQEFKKDFERSGMSQKAYSKHKQISASMVSYYLRKARETETVISSIKPKNFEQIKIDSPSVSRLKITTSKGVIIEFTL